MATLFLVIIVISLLILVHEWGHFYSARRLGIRVEEFGFGFPPRLVSKVRKGIRYSLNVFPFGGFVKIFGEHGEGEHDKQSFISRPVWQRFLVIGAGVGMNFVLAWFFFSVGAAIGVPEISDEHADGAPVSIISVVPGSPAEKAGLRFGDAILEIRTGHSAQRIEKEEDVRSLVDAHRGKIITLVVRRGNEVRMVDAAPRVLAPEGEGPLGIALGYLRLMRVPWYRAPIAGAEIAMRSTRRVLEGMGAIFTRLFTSGTVGSEVAGPIGIFLFAHDLWALGIAYFMQFIGVLSINLAVLNFLPIPALDGGRIFFLVIEKFRGTRIHPRMENTVHTIGFIILILLMIVVTYRDIARIL